MADSGKAVAETGAAGSCFEMSSGTCSGTEVVETRFVAVAEAVEAAEAAEVETAGTDQGPGIEAAEPGIGVVPGTRFAALGIRPETEGSQSCYTGTSVAWSGYLALIFPAKSLLQ